MKHINTISSGIQSAAKLTFLFLFLTSTLAAEDAPFARVAGVWATHFGNGVSRIYRISEDGTVTYEQRDPDENKSSKIETINGEVTANFGNRLSVFHTVSEDQMNVVTFASRDDLEKNHPVTSGKAYRAHPSNPNDAILGTWKWLLDARRSTDGMIQFRADGTFTLVGTSKLGIWKSGGDRSYSLSWVSSEENGRLVLSPDGNGLESKNGAGRAITAERMQAVADASVALASPAPVPPVVQTPTTTPVPVVPPAPATPVAAEPKPVIRSIEKLLSGVDTSKPLKPFDRVDFDVINQIDKDLRVYEGKEIEIEVQPDRKPTRNTETQFRWQLAPLKSGMSNFTPAITVNVFRDDVGTALAIVPGKSAVLHGVIQRCTVSYSNGPLLHVTIQESTLKLKDGEPIPAVVNPVASVRTAASTPTPAVPQQPAPGQPSKNISLKTGWDGPMQGGSKTLEDLALVLNGYAKADPNPPFEDVEIYNGVKYLMPLSEAVVALGIKGRLPSMKKVVCPGFPRESLNYTSFDGLFEGHYNRMDIVTDMANQVVAIQFVDEHPKDTATVQSAYRGNWMTYNFVGYRVKAVTTLSVEYAFEAYDDRQSRWRRSQVENLARYYPTSPALRVFTYLIEKHQNGKADKRLEETLWCVPRPFASLILYCASKGQR